MRLDAKVTDLLPAVERLHTDNERVQISTAPGTDGIVRRIEVRSTDGQPNANWVAFALSNNTDEQVDRLIVRALLPHGGLGHVLA